MLPLACANKATFIYLQSLGSTAVHACEVVFGVGVALLLPVSDVLTFVISAAVIVHTC